MKSDNNKNWGKLVRLSRNEEAPSIDVRQSLMSELRKTPAEQTPIDLWLNSIVDCFNPGLVKFGFALFLVCLILLTTFTKTPTTLSMEQDDSFNELFENDLTLEDLL